MTKDNELTKEGEDINKIKNQYEEYMIKNQYKEYMKNNIEDKWEDSENEDRYFKNYFQSLYEIISERGIFEERGKQIGKLVDQKQLAYGDAISKSSDVLKILLSPYKNEDENTYTIPESLLDHLLILVRMVDKLARICNNPDGNDAMGESPYVDIGGYSLLGDDKMQRIRNKNKL